MSAKRSRALDRKFAEKAEKIAKLRARYSDMQPVANGEWKPKPPFSSLQHAFRRARSESRPTKYQRYLQSDHWRAFRLSVLAKRGNNCEVCGCFPRHPQLNHLTYERLGRELESEVVVTCDDCHRSYHGLPAQSKQIAAFRKANKPTGHGKTKVFRLRNGARNGCKDAPA